MLYWPIAFRSCHAATLFRCSGLLAMIVPLCGCHVLERPRSEPTSPTAAIDVGQTPNFATIPQARTSPLGQGDFMSDIHLVCDYPYPPEKVWRVLTEPALMAHWALNGRPEGFSTAVGTHFRLVGKSRIGWSGVIECEVLEAREPSVLRYSWVADGGDALQLTYRLEPHNGVTRFTFDQTGFKGIGGFLLAKLVMTPVRKKMFGERIPNLLNDLDNDLGSMRKPNE